MKKINFHLVFLAAVILFVGIGVWKIYDWNKGEDSGYDPNEISTDFDTDPQDYIQPMPKALLEGREDDGVNTILCLGNSPFSDDKNGTGLAARIAGESGNSQVYDCSFAESYISQKNQTYSADFARDGFSLYPVTKAFCTGDYSVLDAAIAASPRDDNDYSIKLLKSLDFSKIDTIVIMYDISDYIEHRPVMDPGDDSNLLTVCGSLYASAKLIQETYPYIRIVFLTHPSCGFTADSYYVDGAVIDLGNGTLVDYLLHEINTAQAAGFSLIDVFYGVIPETKREEYLTQDYHLNEAGRQAVAERFAQLIYPADPEGA